MRVLGMDPSLRNWGMATGILDPASMKLSQVQVAVIQPSLPTGKQTRQNSLDIESAKQLFEVVKATAQGMQAIFVEVPGGSQSARAMASYALCCGVLGSLRAAGIQFFEVTPSEVKLAGAGLKTATKKQMIDWAVQAHPEANWPTYKRKGETLISESDAEHMADAVAAIYAGTHSNPFRQLLSMLRAA